MTVPEAAVGSDPDADERARVEARLRLRRGRLATAIVAGVLVVLASVVALLGGFRERSDLLTPVAAGTVIATGPYEVSLDKATVRHTTSDDTWQVVVSGTARTTGPTSINPLTGESGFVFVRDAAGGEVEASQAIELGDTSAVETQDSLTPGLPPVPWAVTFRFTSAPSDTLLVAVFEQEYTTPYLFSDEEGWRPTRKASTMKLPLERLPDAEF